MIGKENRNGMDFSDLYSDNPFLKYEFYNILTAADIFTGTGALELSLLVPTNRAPILPDSRA